ENFDWNYLAGLLFPMAGMVADGNEMYIGLIPCLALFCFIRKKPVFTFRDGFLALGLAYTFLFTMGRSTPVRMWSARHLPLLGAFGFSHSVGVFLLLGLLVWLAP